MGGATSDWGTGAGRRLRPWGSLWGVRCAASWGEILIPVATAVGATALALAGARGAVWSLVSSTKT